MKKPIIVLVCLLIAVLVVFRFIKMIPIGTGEAIESPNGAYLASITEFSGETFFGHGRRWFEFELNRKSGENLKKIRTTPIEGPYFGSRSHNRVIFWSDDSSEVVFRFPQTEVKMVTRTKPAK